MPTTQKYRFTAANTGAILALGYQFHGVSPEEFPAFMQKNFPGFDLNLLLHQVEEILVKHAGGPVSRKITVHGSNFQVELENDHGGEEEKALVFDRVFYRKDDNITIGHQYLIIPKQAQDQGLSKKVLKASLTQYLKMGASEIRMKAGLSAGAYVWARHGFVAVNRAEMDVIMRRAKTMITSKQFQFVNQTYEHYYQKNPNGTEFPIRRWANLPFMKAVLTGGQIVWEGRLDLKNKAQLRKFERYVSK